MGSRGRLCTAFVVSMLAAAPGAIVAGQQPTFKAETNLIEVDAVVTDAAGSIVRGLTKNDFTLLDDGKPQAVSTFAFVDLPLPPSLQAGTGTVATTPADVTTNQRAFDGRVYLIVLDDVHIAANEAPLVVDKVRLFLDKYFHGNDLAAVMYLSGRTDFGADFTNDTSRLLAAVQPLNGHAPHPSAVVPQYFAVYRRIARLSDWANDVMPGRHKALLFFTPGVDGPTDDQANNSDGLVQTFDPARRPGRGGAAGGGDATFRRIDANDQIAESVRDAIAAANRANVSLFPIDARGTLVPDNGFTTLPGSIGDETPTRTGHDFDLPVLNGHIDLRAMSADTGGEPVLNTNGFGNGFARIVRDNSAYYALAYAAPAGRKPGSLHSIRLVINRPGLVVHGRKGYAVPLAAPDPAAVRAPIRPGNTSPEVTAALNNPVPSNGVDVAAFAVPFKATGGAASVLVGVELTNVPTSGPDAARIADVELSVVVTDSTAVKAGRVDRVRLTVPPSDNQTAAVRILHRLSLPPGHYQLRAAAREGASGRIGSIVRDLDVPDFARPLGMSGLVLASNRSRELPTGGDAERLTTLLDAAPAAGRQFSPADVITAFAEIYDADTTLHDDLVTTTITDDHGGQVFNASETVASAAMQNDRGAYDYRVRVPVDDLDGRYVLKIEVRSRAGDNLVVSQAIPFSVTR